MTLVDERNALERCESAESFTSPYGTPAPPQTYKELQILGLIFWAPGWRLNFAGRTRLAKLRGMSL